MKEIHSTITTEYLENRPINRLLNGPTLDIDNTEETLARGTRRTLAQLRTNKCPLLKSYLNKIDNTNNPEPDCPLCGEIHDTTHLFRCVHVPTGLGVRDLWESPVEVARLLGEWGEKLGWPHGWT
jgi:hypothetical protein